MATAEEIVADVQDIIKDTRYTDAFCLAKINEGLVKIASEPRVVFQGLESVDTVNTEVGTNVVALPTGCGSIYKAFDGYAELTVYDSWAKMYRDYLGNLTGDVVSVAVKDGTMMYLPEPESIVEITLFFNRNPTPLALGETPADTIEGFTPRQLHFVEDAVKFYASYKIFDRLEDAVEDPKSNTLHYKGLYLEAKSKLILLVREGMNRPTVPRNALW